MFLLYDTKAATIKKEDVTNALELTFFKNLATFDNTLIKDNTKNGASLNSSNILITNGILNALKTITGSDKYFAKE